MAKPFVILATPVAMIGEVEPNREGERSSLTAAFAFARKIWREYKGTAKVEVRYHGALIASDPSDFTMRRE